MKIICKVNEKQRTTHGIKQLGICGYSSVTARCKRCSILTGTSIAAQPISYRQTLYAIAPKAHRVAPSYRSFTCHRTPGQATAHPVHTRTGTCKGHTSQAQTQAIARACLCSRTKGRRQLKYRPKLINKRQYTRGVYRIY